MRALVVYESMFGNTETVARAVAEGLSSALVTEVVEVSKAPRLVGGDLLVVGGPTHALGMSRPKTRADALTQSGGTLASPGDGIREWLGALAPGYGKAAAFDTKVAHPRVPGSAAHAAARRLHRLGFTLVGKPHTFYVGGTKGPLADGETDRARAWGRGLAEQARDGAHHAHATPAPDHIG
jgi:hypothetical protein